LINDSIEYTIVFNNFGVSKYQPPNSDPDQLNAYTIYWDPRMGVVCGGANSFGILSPARVLAHEMDHAANYDIFGHLTGDSNYTNLEEKRVIEGSEKTIGEELNESLGVYEGFRQNHNQGTLQRMDSPIFVPQP